jgi:hypothetical protein
MGSLDMSAAPLTAGTLPVTNRVEPVAAGADTDGAVVAETDGAEVMALEVLFDEEHPATASAAAALAAIKIRMEDIGLGP